MARRAVSETPTLIPVYVHRYLPAEPGIAENPIFSVHQKEIIVYCDDLASYFHAEFDAPLPSWSAMTPRPIRFWGGLSG